MIAMFDPILLHEFSYDTTGKFMNFNVKYHSIIPGDFFAPNYSKNYSGIMYTFLHPACQLIY